MTSSRGKNLRKEPLRLGGGGKGRGEEEGKGAVERRARLGLGHLPMMLPHPWREAPGTDFPTGNVYDCVSVLWAGHLD